MNDLMGTRGYLGHGNKPQVPRVGQNKAIFQLPPKEASSAGWLRTKIYVMSRSSFFLAGNQLAVEMYQGFLRTISSWEDGYGPRWTGAQNSNEPQKSRTGVPIPRIFHSPGVLEAPPPLPWQELEFPGAQQQGSSALTLTTESRSVTP